MMAIVLRALLRMPGGLTRLLAGVMAVFCLAMPALAQGAQRHLLAECIACHGEDGIAKDKDVPHLAGQNYEYLVKQIHDFQKGRRPHKEMRVMSRHMTDDELAEIADYYARLPREPK